MNNEPNRFQTVNLFAYYLSEFETEDKTAYTDNSVLNSMNTLDEAYNTFFIDIYNKILNNYGENELECIGYDIICKRFIEAKFKKGFKEKNEIIKHITKDMNEISAATKALKSIEKYNRNLGFEKDMIIDLFKNHVSDNGDVLIETGDFADGWTTQISINYSNDEIAKMGIEVWDIIKDEVEKEIKRYDDFDLNYTLSNLFLGFGLYEYIYMVVENIFLKNLKEENNE